MGILGSVLGIVVLLVIAVLFQIIVRRLIYVLY